MKYTNGKTSKHPFKMTTARQVDPPAAELLTIQNMANAKKTKQAISAGQKLITRHPKSAVTQNLMGVIFAQTGDIRNAAKHLISAVNINPRLADAHNNLGNCFEQVGNREKALYAFKQAAEIEPKNALYQFNLGSAYLELRKNREALQHLKTSIEIDATQPAAWNRLGNAYRMLGHQHDALSSYEHALALAPQNTYYLKNLSAVKKMQPDDPEFHAAEQVLENPELLPEDEVRIRFTLGKMYDDISEYDQAFEHFAAGNAKRKQISGYHIEQDYELYDKIRRIFAKDALPAPEKPTTGHPTPIFIVGMPRSGTTLAEQILTNHSRVAGAGEYRLLGDLTKPIMNANTKVLRDQVAHVRQEYLKGIQAYAGNADYVTDKLPLNSRWIGLIRAALPEAPIIRTVRDPMAVCWSIYRLDFSSTGNAYAYDLGDLAQYHHLYEDLMSFWKTDSPEPIYDLNYEKLTTDQEKQTSALLRFCGLEWEDACLNFHTSKREVNTASALQVRQAMYQGSSKAWKKYEPHLRDLIQGLNASKSKS